MPVRNRVGEEGEGLPTKFKPKKLLVLLHELINILFFVKCFRVSMFVYVRSTPNSGEF